jgi:hypothetical protein
MDERTRGNRPESQRAAAAYVADLAADLARMARGHGLDALGYLLDMARLEARTVAGEFESHDPPI